MADAGSVFDLSATNLSATNLSATKRPRGEGAAGAAWLRLAAALALTFAACGSSSDGDSTLDVGIGANEDATAGSSVPYLEATPSVVEFEGGVDGSVTLWLRNGGKSGGITVISAQLESGSSEELSLANFNLGTLSPGEERAALEVVFTPGGKEAWKSGLIGTIVVEHDHPVQPILQIPVYVSGSGEIPSDAGIGEDTVEPPGVLQVEPRTVVLRTLLAPGSEDVETYVISSIDGGLAEVASLTLSSALLPGEAPDASPFSLHELRLCTPDCVAIVPNAVNSHEFAANEVKVGPPSSSRLEVDLRYVQPLTYGKRSASLLVQPAKGPSVVASFSASGVFPSAMLGVSQVDIGTVRSGEVASNGFQVDNTGPVALSIYTVSLETTQPFELLLPDGTTVSAGQTLTLAPEAVVEIGGYFEVQYSYTPTDAAPASALVRITTNASPSLGAELTLLIKANQAVPCLAIEPTDAAMGEVPAKLTAKFPITLRNCGGVPVAIQGVEVTAPEFSLFGLSFEGFPGFPEAPPPSIQSPTLVPAGGSAFFNVEYWSSAPSVWVDGAPVVDTGTITVRSDSFFPELSILASAFAGSVYCPVASLLSVPDEPLQSPLTTLQLDGTSSLSPAGPITAYYWAVTAPPGATAWLNPSPGSPQPLLELHSVGQWDVGLVVADAQGVASCTPVVQSFEVSAPDGLHVELFWQPPLNPVETPAADLELHLAHQNAAGFDVDGDDVPEVWFDNKWDCYWFNPSPDWAPGGGSDPQMLRTDATGAGPEVVALAVPEAASPYRLGVRHAGSPGAPTATPRLKVWYSGTLALDLTGPALVAGDLWEAAVLLFDGGFTAEPLTEGGKPKVFANFPTGQ